MAPSRSTRDWKALPRLEWASAWLGSNANHRSLRGDGVGRIAETLEGVAQAGEGRELVWIQGHGLLAGLHRGLEIALVLEVHGQVGPAIGRLGPQPDQPPEAGNRRPQLAAAQQQQGHQLGGGGTALQQHGQVGEGPGADLARCDQLAIKLGVLVALAGLDQAQGPLLPSRGPWAGPDPRLGARPGEAPLPLSAPTSALQPGT